MDKAVREFIRKVVLCALDGMSVDGDSVQDWAVEAGILAPTTVTEACGENCNCAEWDDFPQTCYRFTSEYACTAGAPEGSLCGSQDEGKQAGGASRSSDSRLAHENDEVVGEPQMVEVGRACKSASSKSEPDSSLSSPTSPAALGRELTDEECEHIHVHEGVLNAIDEQRRSPGSNAAVWEIIRAIHQALAARGER